MGEKNIGFIGLGIMGSPMAKHLIEAGYETAVYDKNIDTVKHMVGEGAKPCESPSDVASKSKTIIVMVPDSSDVKAVISDDNGILETIRTESVVIDMSTISPKVGIEMANLLESRGAKYVDAPVTGGVVGAHNASLSILVGGDAETYELVLPILKIMGGSVTHMGPNGTGHAAKLANQILGIGCMVGLAEGLVFAEKMGLDLSTFMDAAAKGASTSWMLENVGPTLLDRDFSPGFMARHMRKDLRLDVEAAGDVHAAVPITSIISQLYEQMLSEGDGSVGHHAIIKVIERLSGIKKD